MMGWKADPKALEKLIVARIIRDPGLGLLNPSNMDRERNRIWSRIDRPGRKPVWWRERMELDSRKEHRRDKIMRSKSFKTQEETETGRKEARESRGFSSYEWE